MTDVTVKAIHAVSRVIKPAVINKNTGTVERLAETEIVAPGTIFVIDSEAADDLEAMGAIEKTKGKVPVKTKSAQSPSDPLAGAQTENITAGGEGENLV